jgi:hypothetical protein
MEATAVVTVGRTLGFGTVRAVILGTCGVWSSLRDILRSGQIVFSIGSLTCEINCANGRKRWMRSLPILMLVIVAPNARWRRGNGHVETLEKGRRIR